MISIRPDVVFIDHSAHFHSLVNSKSHATNAFADQTVGRLECNLSESAWFSKVMSLPNGRAVYYFQIFIHREDTVARNNEVNLCKHFQTDLIYLHSELVKTIVLH